MSAGLLALLDDVAALSKAAATSLDDVTGVAARASGKAIGVVIDDTAVTPQYVAKIAPKRELPIIAKIARGSIINKAVILVVALLLNYFLPAALTPILMVGGAYLCFEGAEKILGQIFHHQTGAAHDTPTSANATEEEKRIVRGATRTDLILSTEIMVVALNEVRTQSLAMQIGALIVVAFLITALVYGVVALLVKMDDVGLALSRTHHKFSQATGRFLIRLMPAILKVLSIVGVAAMLWVGGHLFFSGLAEVGMPLIFGFMQACGHAVASSVPVASAAGAWLTETVLAMLLGFVLGAIVTVTVWGISAIVKRIQRKNPPEEL